MTVSVSGGELKGADSISAPGISYGRYMPARPYGVGTIWLEVNHYRPEKSFVAGPELTRSVVAEYQIPYAAKPGKYTGALNISGDGAELTLPVTLTVLPIKLPEIPIPVALFMNCLPFESDSLDTAIWWKLQEDLMREQMGAGLNTLTGGAGIRYSVDSAGKISGDEALKLIKIAQKYGTIKAIVPYGGFLPNLTSKWNIKAVAAGLKEFEERHQLPPTYVNSYDEPNTEVERNAALAGLEQAKAAGLKTIGWTSWHAEDKLWSKLIDNTYAPALNAHTAAHIQQLKASGHHP
jgi:hypothetical protein